MDKAINFDNMFSFSAEDIIEFLQNTINEEIQKGEKGMDFVLVEECVLMIEQLYGRKIYRPDQNQIDKKYKELQEKYEKVKEDKAFWDNLIGDNEELKSFINETTNKAPQKPVKRIKFRKTLLVAALIALLSSLFTIISGANGWYNSHDPYLFGEFMKIFIKKDHVIDGNIEYFNLNTNESKNYSSVEDFARSENIQGLYLPENLEIKYITSSESEGNKHIIFNPDDQNIYFSIDVDNHDKYGILADLPAYTKTKTQNGIDVWIYEKETYSPGTGSAQVMFKINEWYYCISTSYPESAIKLIDEFKEILP